MAARLWEFKSPLGHYAPVLQERIYFLYREFQFDLRCPSTARQKARRSAQDTSRKRNWKLLWRAGQIGCLENTRAPNTIAT